MTLREGSLEPPQRHPLAWREEAFYDEQALYQEMERVFDVCHTCRRCVNLCHAFPTLFDLIDESDTLELDSVDKTDYWKVVEHCYLCDLCFMTKCPYVPPHEWAIDFPHLMLRAKAVKFRHGRTPLRDRLITSTDRIGSLAGIPVVAEVVNTLNRTPPARKLLDKVMAIHPEARLPEYSPRPLRRRRELFEEPAGTEAVEAGPTRGRVALFATCYGNYNEPGVGEDLVAVFRHNGIPLRLVDEERCCGMPKLEVGDLEAVDAARRVNVPALATLVEQGWDIIAPVPSCVLMFKQELPLMYPDDPQVAAVAEAIYDPFEYLSLRHRHGALKLDFRQSLGRVFYHAACHQRVQNIGPRTREVLSLVPDTEVTTIERCSGHDGTYAVKRESHDIAMKLVRPIARQLKKVEPDHYGSDCPMAGHHIEFAAGGKPTEHPISLLRLAYGI